MARGVKLTEKEREYAKLLVDGYKPVDAYRQVFNAKCEPYTPEAQRARDLARTARVKNFVNETKDQQEKEAHAETISRSKLDMDQLRQFAFNRLVEIRDDPTKPARPRWAAIQALEKLSDPSKDINLIWRWVDLVWRGYLAHCPCCHLDFPLEKINNERLNKFRNDHNLPPGEVLESVLDRRLAVFGQAEKRKKPHTGQLKALSSPERHVAGLGPARAGKSFTLSIFAYLFFLIPGVEIWILARVFDEARSEMDYLEGFLKSLFYPVYHHVVIKTEDKRSGEVALVSRWGSEIRIKSGRSQGSITGRELEAALVAEPAWVESELYEEVRARMSSRMGRILAFGTPKGFGGFIHRMVKLTGRTMTGKRVNQGDKLIANGCPWNKSLFVFNMDPRENPEYVVEELEAAREELTDEEFASEFEGRMAAAEGARFPHIKEEQLREIRREEYERCAFAVGVDQGERNFGAVMVGWDGKQVFVAREWFDKSDATIKANLIQINEIVPGIVKLLSGTNTNWQYTIFDADPPVWNILTELETENRPWKTEVTYRPKNKPEFLNWREETMMWINELAKQGNLVFDPKCDFLLDQLRDALRPQDTDHVGTKKGWVVKDPYRADHVVDAFLLAMWLVFSNTIEIKETFNKPSETPWEEAKKAALFARKAQEAEELSGWEGKERSQDEIFKSIFGRPREQSMGWMDGNYSDES
jgi:hypothetical protein